MKTYDCDVMGYCPYDAECSDDCLRHCGMGLSERTEEDENGNYETDY